MSNLLVKLSVIIPVYNSAKYLQRCIESVTKQSLREIEIVIIDDGSTDDSWRIIQAFASKDSRVVAMRQKNQGVSTARNKGLSHATGEYFGFVDSDDYVDARYFEELYRAAASKDADIAIGSVAMNNERRQHFYNYTNKRSAIKNKHMLMGVVWLNIYRKAMLKKNNILFPSDLRTAEDNLFNLQATYYANKVVSTQDGGAMYRHEITEGSLTAQQYDSKNLMLLSRAVLETVDTLNTLDPYDEEVYKARVIDTLNYFYRRFIESNQLDTYTRYRITIIFMRIWKRVKYRTQLLKEIEEKDIDIQGLMYGWVANRLYRRSVVELKGEVKKRKLRRINKSDVKVFVKRAVRFVTPYGVVMRYKRRLQVSSKSSAPHDDNKIAVVAAYHDTEYISLLKSAVKQAGFAVSKYPGDAKYVWLHWYENGIQNYDDFVRKLSVIQSWKDQDKKIILHIHNRKPHESPVPQLSHALMTALCDLADHVSIMSGETKDLLKDMWYYGDDFSQISTVPHPNYVGVYGKMLKVPADLKDDTLKILFFGQVRPYKGVEHLIRATEGLKNVEISILGKPKDDQYIASLERLSEGRDNVKFRLEFIPDSDIPEAFASHHVVALPYNIDSSLNSGAAVLALSYGRTIVGTNNGTLKQLGRDDVYFGYDYTDEEDHMYQLRKSIKSIQATYEGKYSELLKVGDKAFKLVERDNSIEAVSESIKAMIQRVG